MRSNERQEREIVKKYQSSSTNELKEVDNPIHIEDIDCNRELFGHSKLCGE